MKKKVTQAYSIGTAEGDGMTGKVFPHCNAVGFTDPHKNNSCYFDQNRMTDIREWACKLMDEKGVACNEDE